MIKCASRLFLAVISSRKALVVYGSWLVMMSCSKFYLFIWARGVSNCHFYSHLAATDMQCLLFRHIHLIDNSCLLFLFIVGGGGGNNRLTEYRQSDLFIKSEHFLHAAILPYDEKQSLFLCLLYIAYSTTVSLVLPTKTLAACCPWTKISLNVLT